MSMSMSMSMPIHALRFYSPQAGSRRAIVKEESAHLSDTRGATPKLGNRSDVMANVTMQLMGEDSGSARTCVLACTLRMSSEVGCELVAKWPVIGPAALAITVGMFASPKR